MKMSIKTIPDEETRTKVSKIAYNFYEGMNHAKSKKEFIEAWNSHISDFNILAFCNDRDSEQKVLAIMEELKGLVIKIADSKRWTR